VDRGEHDVKSGKEINPAGSIFGLSSIVHVLRQNKTAGAEQIVNAVFDDLHRFQQQAELEDDLTLVIIRIDKEN
jgi:serine phosphatase RsbU (regulator of sigma subunit)